MLTAMLLASPGAVALIVTAKAIARYPQFSQEHFTECFLIGTLLSLSVALAAEICLLRAFHGKLMLTG